jgi:hypothetical protein
MPVAMTMYTEKQGKEANCTHVKQVAEARKIRTLTCKLATHKELHNCSLCLFGVQILLQPDENKTRI